MTISTYLHQNANYLGQAFDDVQHEEDHKDELEVPEAAGSKYDETTKLGLAMMLLSFGGTQH